MRLENLKFKENVLAVLVKNGKKKTIRAKNIIGNAGDIYYAQMCSGETPTNAFVNAVLGTGSTAATKNDDYDNMTPISESNKAPSSGYPKTNDDDGDNTDAGVDIITWKYEWSGADFSDTAIREGTITIASPTTGSPILTRWVWDASFGKDADTTLKLFVNHAANGV